MDPTLALAIKLASIIAHLEEGYGPKGHPADLQAAQSLRNDPEVVAAFAWMESHAMIPVPR